MITITVTALILVALVFILSSSDITYCHHDFQGWKEWGVNFQQGKCTKCETYKIRDQ